MARRLTPFEAELYHRTDEVLHYVWDPIGVKDVPHARGEYDHYLSQVFDMLLQSKNQDEISNYLLTVAQEQMGLKPNTEHATRVARVLLDWLQVLRLKYQT